MNNLENIKAFWEWFQSSHHKYLFLDDVAEDEKEDLMNDCLNRLRWLRIILFARSFFVIYYIA